MKRKFQILFCIGLIALCSCTGSRNTSHQKKITGTDRDVNECIASAGYTWSEVQKNCIRLFEQGVRMEASDEKCCYLVFAKDSTEVEIFFSDGRQNEILNRKSLPKGGYVWNVKEEDAKNVRYANGKWCIEQRGMEIFSQAPNCNQLGTMVEQTFEGLLPASDCQGIVYSLAIRHCKYSGDGIYALVKTYQKADNGKDKSFSQIGRRFTLRGMEGKQDATVWQLRPDDRGEILNFLVEDDSTILLLDQNIRIINSQLNYRLKKK
ncbi:MAG: copper resistance protein NlpE N-terminal domain-containing protein [Bacteroidales bacterium]